jgi:hypothetical protein
MTKIQEGTIRHDPDTGRDYEWTGAGWLLLVKDKDAEIERLTAQLRLMSMTAVGAEKEADDAHALIRELVAALNACYYAEIITNVESISADALAKAKEQGYEP